MYYAKLTPDTSRDKAVLAHLFSILTTQILAVRIITIYILITQVNALVI